MRISVVGSGYVGLVTSACLADSGNHVVAVDRDADRVAELADGACPIYEPGLPELLGNNLAAGRLRFTTDTDEAVSTARVVFIAVGTPPGADGSPELSNVDAVADAIAQAVIGYTVVVVKSTVPVGTCRRLARRIRERGRQPCPVVSNPEFLKEGSAVDDYLRPDRVVIGADEEEAGTIVAELHKPFVRNNRPILMMSTAAAEMTKYAANAYLATRISFINEMAEICERLGVDVDEVRRGIGTDSRIGNQFLYPGLGYGGSCFPKDVIALERIARTEGASAEILSAVHDRNQRQRALLIEKIHDRLGASLTGRRFAVWGLSFKPKTDDLREAPALAIVESLLEAGAQVAVHDPQALRNARAVLGDRVTYHEDAYAALAGADALLTLTEWMEYRSPDFDRIRDALEHPLIFDGRNLYDCDMMRRYHFEYHSVGRSTVPLGDGTTPRP